MELEIEGLDDLIELISNMEDDAEKTMDEALVAGGDLLKDKMKNEVYAHGLSRRSGEALRAIVRTDPVNNELYVGTQGGKKAPGYYLYMHEFGYYNVRAGRFIGPKPFASIVYENNKEAILEKYAEVFRKKWNL